MKCPSCGAQVNGKFCEYCGSELPKNQPNTINSNNSHTTVINNYYRTEAQPYNTVQNQPYQNRAAYNLPSYQGEFYEETSEKSKGIALLLAIFFGYFGAHQFYAGKTTMGVVYIFTIGLWGIGWFVDIGRIAAGSFKDADGLPIK